MIAAQAGEPAPGLGALSIANCKAYAVREPVSEREYAILRIETTGGIVGWGETRSIASTALARAAAILRGRQATEYGPLHAQLAGLPGLQAAANMALLDIVGQAARAPVYQVLGGPTRHKARAIAPLAGADDAALLGALKRAQAAGAGYRLGEPCENHCCGIPYEERASMDQAALCSRNRGFGYDSRSAA